MYPFSQLYSILWCEYSTMYLSIWDVPALGYFELSCPLIPVSGSLWGVCQERDRRVMHRVCSQLSGCCRAAVPVAPWGWPGLALLAGRGPSFHNMVLETAQEARILLSMSPVSVSGR